MKMTKEELYEYVDNLNANDFGELVIIVADRLGWGNKNEEVKAAIETIKSIGVSYIDCPVSPLD